MKRKTISYLINRFKIVPFLATSFLSLCNISQGDAQTYCTPSGIDCSTNHGIINVSFQNISNSSICATGYNDFTTSIPAATLTPGQSYSIAVTLDNNSDHVLDYLTLWIDYNQNGAFDNSEYQFLGSGNSTIITATVNTLVSSVSGFTRMRLINVEGYPLQPYDVCNSGIGYGEAEDYAIYFNTLPPCSGMPSIGSAISSVTTTCRNTAFDLSINPVLQSGITYQWQSSSNGTIWTSLDSPQTEPLYTVINQTVTTYYQCIVTCTATAASSTCVPIMVSQTSFMNCYCTPNSTNCSSNYAITSVTLATLTNTSSCAGTGGYANYISSVASPTLVPLQTYTIDLTVGSASTKTAIWIDYDHSGTFDASEYQYLGGTTLSVTNTIVIPSSALPGTTRMRLGLKRAVGSQGPLSSTQACGGGNTFGETEDYSVFISCISTPSITAYASNTSVCSAATITLSASGADTYTWSSGATSSLISVIVPFVTASTQVTYTVTGLTMCGSGTTTLSVLVNPPPSMNAVPSKSIICVDDHAPVLLTATGASSYTWTTGSPSGPNIAFTPTVSQAPIVTTAYYVKGLSSAQCSAVASTTVIVSPCTNVKDLSLEESVHIYPNPIYDVMMVSLSDQLSQSNTFVVVYDALGKAVIRENLNSTSSAVSTGGLKEGLYFYQIIRDGSTIKSGKLIKQ